MIQRDIEKSRRWLLPFLTTTDRLRLSECSKGLDKYRYNLSQVNIVWHPSASHATESGLVKLLCEQELGVEYLRVGGQVEGHRTLTKVLDAVLTMGGCKGMKTLSLIK